MQLSEHKTYRTRDGSRTGICIERWYGSDQYVWTETDNPGSKLYNEVGERYSSNRSPNENDLIEETPSSTDQLFSYDACPMHADGRRRAVTRDGREVVLVAGDAPGSLPIVGWILNTSIVERWLADGRSSDAGVDLLIPPLPKRAMTEREKIIEAMARAIYSDEPVMDQQTDPDNRPLGRSYQVQWGQLPEFATGLDGMIRETARKVLTAIAEQGYVVVPRDGPDDFAADACGFLAARDAFEMGYWLDWKHAFYRAMVDAVDIAKQPETSPCPSA